MQVERPVDEALRDYDVPLRQGALRLDEALRCFPLDGENAVKTRSAAIALGPGLVRGATGRAVRHGLLDEVQKLGELARHFLS